MTTTTEAEPTYLFGPRDRRTMLLGLRLPQLLLLGTGVGTLLVGFLSQARYGGSLGVAALLATAFAALFPVQGDQSWTG